MKFRLLLVLLIAISCSAASAKPVQTNLQACKMPDRSFTGFLSRFANNVSFQRSRLVLPLVSRIGDNVTSEQTIELWSLSDVKKLQYPLIVSDLERRKNNYIQDVTMLPGKSSAHVFYGQQDADSFKMLYKFAKFSGCWYLEEVDDLSE